MIGGLVAAAGDTGNSLAQMPRGEPSQNRTSAQRCKECATSTRKNNAGPGLDRPFFYSAELF
jgi:hypothetical protein